MRLSRFAGLAITDTHALAAALPPHHRDPFDRVLVTQAWIEGLTPVTADAMLEAYDVHTVRVQ